MFYLGDGHRCEPFILHVGLYFLDDRVGNVVLVIFEERLQELGGVGQQGLARFPVVINLLPWLGE